MPRRPSLSSTARKRYTEGTHRTLAPQLTLKRVMPLLPALGITRIANVTGLDTIGIPVVVVARPNARSLSVAQGKGSTLAAAQASGVMESIEFWHAERIDRPLRLASARDLALNRPLANLDRLPRLSVSNFSPRLPILWIEGRQLHDAEPERGARAELGAPVGDERVERARVVARRVNGEGRRVGLALVVVHPRELRRARREGRLLV
jgi:ribosomal protein S12 methylthiotransferase accessory factor YcaO